MPLLSSFFDAYKFLYKIKRNGATLNLKAFQSFIPVINYFFNDNKYSKNDKSFKFMEAAIKRFLLGISILFGIWGVGAYERPKHELACEKAHRHCFKVCKREHPYRSLNRERCFEKCKHRFRLCLESREPVIIEQDTPLFADPYFLDPYPPVFINPDPWGGHPHHSHHHHHRR